MISYRNKRTQSNKPQYSQRGILKIIVFTGWQPTLLIEIIGLTIIDCSRVFAPFDVELDLLWVAYKHHCWMIGGTDLIWDLRCCHPSLTSLIIQLSATADSGCILAGALSIYTVHYFFTGTFTAVINLTIINHHRSWDDTRSRNRSRLYLARFSTPSNCKCFKLIFFRISLIFTVY